MWTEAARAFFEQEIEVHLPTWWEFMKARYPKACAKMEAAVPREYWINGTPFTKVTVRACLALP